MRARSRSDVSCFVAMRSGLLAPWTDCESNPPDRSASSTGEESGHRFSAGEIPHEGRSVGASQSLRGVVASTDDNWLQPRPTTAQFLRISIDTAAPDALAIPSITEAKCPAGLSGRLHGMRFASFPRRGRVAEVDRQGIRCFFDGCCEGPRSAARPQSDTTPSSPPALVAFPNGNHPSIR